MPFEKALMTHLLDTNAWLRVANWPEELSSAVRGFMASTPGPFALSAISVWEVCLKVRKGKLSLTSPLDDWLKAALQPGFVQVISIDAEIARVSNELPEPFHEDPADRLIIATARVHGLTIITSDRQILAYPHAASLW